MTLSTFEVMIGILNKKNYDFLNWYLAIVKIFFNVGLFGNSKCDVRIDEWRSIGKNNSLMNAGFGITESAFLTKFLEKFENWNEISWNFWV